MEAALWLLCVQGGIGAFDTFYYHEYRARLPARVPETARELKIHALRDFLYALIFGSLPWLAFHGAFVLGLGAVLVTEIGLTMADFVEERRARVSLGDVFGGERVTHALMGIVYGAMLACAIPTFIAWWGQPSAVVSSAPAVPEALRWVLSAMALGVFVSGLRDLYAAFGLPGGGWPWPEPGREAP